MKTGQHECGHKFCHIIPGHQTQRGIINMASPVTLDSWNCLSFDNGYSTHKKLVACSYALESLLGVWGLWGPKSPLVVQVRMRLVIGPAHKNPDSLTSIQLERNHQILPLPLRCASTTHVGLGYFLRYIFMTWLVSSKISIFYPGLLSLLFSPS